MRLTTGYSLRPAAEEDASAIADLMNAHSLAVLGQPTAAADDVRTFLQSPGVDLVRDTRIVTAPGGGAAGFASLRQGAPYVQPDATVAVHPSHAGIGLGSALVAWAESQARESIALAPVDARVTIRQSVWAKHSVALDLLRARGYAAARTYARMEIALGSAPAAPECPDGITIRPYQGDEDLADAIRTIVDAFRDHWGSVEEMQFDEYLEEWRTWMATSGRFDPAQWLLALDGEEIVGIATAMGATNEDPAMAHIEDLGVLRRWRGRGVGTALLLALLGVLRQLGFERAVLYVDTDSLTGATRLYERVGFLPTRLSLLMERELRPGRDLRAQTASA